MSTLKQQLLEAARVAHRDVEVGDVTVRVRGFTAAMQLQVEAASERGGGEITFWMLENCLLDPETDQRLFEDNDPAVRDLDGEQIIELVNIAMELTKGGAEAIKNSEGVPSSEA